MRSLLFLLMSLNFVGYTYGANKCDSVITQAQMNECSALSYREADTQLNTIYKSIMGEIKVQAEMAQHLKAAQKIWIIFRDAECKFVADRSAGGSIQPMVLSACLDRLTRARTEQLKSYTRCNEGDVSCPLP